MTSPAPPTLSRRHAAGASSARGLLFTVLGEFVLPGGGTAWTSAVIAAFARLGVAEKEMAWQPVEGFTIVWSDKAAYQRKLGEITEAQREKLHATVDALRQRRLLSESEAETVAPRLIVTVQCEMKPCPLI